MSDGLGDRVIAVDGATVTCSGLRLRQLSRSPRSSRAAPSTPRGLADFRPARPARACGASTTRRHAHGRFRPPSKTGSLTFSDCRRSPPDADCDAALCLIRQLIQLFTFWDARHRARTVAPTARRHAARPHDDRRARIRSAIEQSGCRATRSEELGVVLRRPRRRGGFDESGRHHHDQDGGALSLVLGRTDRGQRSRAPDPQLLLDARAPSAIGEQGAATVPNWVVARAHAADRSQPGFRLRGSTRKQRSKTLSRTRVCRRAGRTRNVFAVDPRRCWNQPHAPPSCRLFAPSAPQPLPAALTPRFCSYLRGTDPGRGNHNQHLRPRPRRYPPRPISVPAPTPLPAPHQ